MAGGGGSGPRPEAATLLQPGTLMLLYTDGLVEARGRSPSDRSAGAGSRPRRAQSRSSRAGVVM
ncbi:MAG: SpoIIE family protein phosphatase [Geodermatophilales bacterium]|nr:SpoIIE family protein phosphatase [Geodermatophilales bacterium]